MWRLICQVCEEKHRHLVLVCDMPICWNTWYAEIEQAIKLKPVSQLLDELAPLSNLQPQVINQWIDQLDQHLTGKKKTYY
jgi:hypothetical protein